jgi:serine/threonine protein kinase
MKENMTGKTFGNFDFIKVIGEGAWAQVYLGEYIKDGSQVAIKAVPKHKIKEVPKLEELVKTEIKVLRECKNENVIRFVDNFSSDKTIFIAT